MCLDVIEKTKIPVPVRSKILAIKQGIMLIITHLKLLER
jgi:hypothetical protein